MRAYCKKCGETVRLSRPRFNFRFYIIFLILLIVLIKFNYPQILLLLALVPVLFYLIQPKNKCPKCGRKVKIIREKKVKKKKD